MLALLNITQSIYASSPKNNMASLKLLCSQKISTNHRLARAAQNLPGPIRTAPLTYFVYNALAKIGQTNQTKDIHFMPGSSIYTCTFSSDSKTIAVCDEDGIIGLYYTQDGTLKNCYQLGSSKAFLHMQFAQNNTRLIGASDKELILLDITKKKITQITSAKLSEKTKPLSNAFPIQLSSSLLSFKQTLDRESVVINALGDNLFKETCDTQNLNLKRQRNIAPKPSFKRSPGNVVTCPNGHHIATIQGEYVSLSRNRIADLLTLPTNQKNILDFLYAAAQDWYKQQPHVVDSKNKAFQYIKKHAPSLAHKKLFLQKINKKRKLTDRSKQSEHQKKQCIPRTPCLNFSLVEKKQGYIEFSDSSSSNDKQEQRAHAEK